MKIHCKRMSKSSLHNKGDNMYIEPQTSIKLLHNIPVDNTYEHTMYFSSATDQYNAFVDYVKYNLTGYSYQRVQRGCARVGLKADLIYDCNYMMFQNTAYGNKWFYAFITSVEYVNDITSEIRFEIDVMQTWLFDYTLGATYIERQHSTSDKMFEHYEPEPLDFGDLKTYLTYTGTVDWSKQTLVICTAPLTDGETSTLALSHDGQSSYAEYYRCNNNSTSVNGFINDVLPSGQQDSILSAYLVPSIIVDGTKTYDDAVHVGDQYLTNYYSESLGSISIPADVDGYKPKNNKLFSSPYCLYEVTDCCGNSQFYKPELFTDGSAPEFHMVGKYTGIPQILVYPKNYRGESDNYSEGFLCANFPQVATPVDTYRAWLAQNGYATFLSGVSSTAFAAAGFLTGNPLSVASGGFGVAQAVNQAMVASTAPNKLQTTDNTDILGMMKAKHPWLKSKTITALYAEMIDDYFTKYGYAVGKVTTPIRNARKYFTFLKTKDVVIKGSIPANDVPKIASVYNRGCTWWTSLNVVGDYSVTNSIN